MAVPCRVGLEWAQILITFNLHNNAHFTQGFQASASALLAEEALYLMVAGVKEIGNGCCHSRALQQPTHGVPAEKIIDKEALTRNVKLV